MTSIALAKGIKVEQVKKDSGTRREGPVPPASRTVGCLCSMQNQMQLSSKGWGSTNLSLVPRLFPRPVFDACSTIISIPMSNKI